MGGGGVKNREGLFSVSPPSVSCCVPVEGVPPPPVLVKAEVTPAPKDGPVRKAVPNQFPLLERVKGKSADQLKALEESFQRSSSPSDSQRGSCTPFTTAP